MFQTSTAVEPRPIASPTASATGPGDDQADQGRGGQHHDDEGQQQHRGAELPDRPALADLVHPVHRPAERADVPRRRPERTGEAEDQGEPGARAGAQLDQRGLEGVRDRPGADVAQDAEEGVDALAAVADQARPATSGRSPRGRSRARRSRSAPRPGRCTGPWRTPARSCAARSRGSACSGRPGSPGPARRRGSWWCVARSSGLRTHQPPDARPTPRRSARSCAPTCVFLRADPCGPAARPCGLAPEPCVLAAGSPLGCGHVRPTPAQRAVRLRDRVGGHRGVRHRPGPDAAAVPDRQPRHRRALGRHDRLPPEGLGRRPQPDRRPDQRPHRRRPRPAPALAAARRPRPGGRRSRCCSPGPTSTPAGSTPAGCWSASSAAPRRTRSSRCRTSRCRPRSPTPTTSAPG